MSDHAPAQTNDAGQSPDWDAIARVLANESTPEEASRVRAWLAASPGDRQLVERLDEAARVPLVDVDVEAALENVHARMHEQPAAPRLTVVRAYGPRSRRIFVTSAAALAAVAAVAVVMFQTSSPTNVPAGALAVREYVTGIGQRDSIMLSDSSRVILGPASHLRVATTYGKDARSVTLDGDAFFDVRHDAAKPFSVRVGRAVVEDIGTSFAVESDAGDTTNVAVISGSVRLRSSDSAANSGAILSAGDRGSMSADGQVRAYPHSVTDEATAWTSGRLVFNEASLVRVAGEIRRWYGINLRFADSSLANHHYTGTFEGESVDQVLKSIGLGLGARIERHGDSATVTSIHGTTTTR